MGLENNIVITPTTLPIPQPRPQSSSSGTSSTQRVILQSPKRPSFSVNYLTVPLSHGAPNHHRTPSTTSTTPQAWTSSQRTNPSATFDPNAAVNRQIVSRPIYTLPPTESSCSIWFKKIVSLLVLPTGIAAMISAPSIMYVFIKSQESGYCKGFVERFIFQSSLYDSSCYNATLSDEVIGNCNDNMQGYNVSWSALTAAACAFVGLNLMRLVGMQNQAGTSVIYGRVSKCITGINIVAGIAFLAQGLSIGVSVKQPFADFCMNTGKESGCYQEQILNTICSIDTTALNAAIILATNVWGIGSAILAFRKPYEPYHMACCNRIQPVAPAPLAQRVYQPPMRYKLNDVRSTTRR